jgi:hypothetical protein
MDETRRVKSLIQAPRCPFCHEDVALGQEAKVCSSCHAIHHEACYGEGAGCSACRAGVVETPAETSARKRWLDNVGNRAVLVLTLALVGGGLGFAFGFTSSNAVRPTSTPPAFDVPIPPLALPPVDFRQASDQKLQATAESYLKGAQAFFDEGLAATRPAATRTRYEQAIDMCTEGLKAADTLRARHDSPETDAGKRLADLRRKCLEALGK